MNKELINISEVHFTESHKRMKNRQQKMRQLRLRLPFSSNRFLRCNLSYISMKEK